MEHGWDIQLRIRIDFQSSKKLGGGEGGEQGGETRRVTETIGY